MWVGVVKHRTVGSSWREEEEEERVMERGRVEGLDYTAHKVTDCLVADSPLCPSFLSFFSFFFFPSSLATCTWASTDSHTGSECPAKTPERVFLAQTMCFKSDSSVIFFFLCVVEWGCSTESRTHCTVRTGFLTSTQTKGKGGF